MVREFELRNAREVANFISAHLKLNHKIIDILVNPLNVKKPYNLFIDYDFEENIEEKVEKKLLENNKDDEKMKINVKFLKIKEKDYDEISKYFLGNVKNYDFFTDFIDYDVDEEGYIKNFYFGNFYNKNLKKIKLKDYQIIKYLKTILKK